MYIFQLVVNFFNLKINDKSAQCQNFCIQKHLFDKNIQIRIKVIMNRRSVLVLLACICISALSFQIKNINHQINPQTSQEYIQYIKALTGISTQQDLTQNKNLASIVQNERLSILNSVDDIVLVLLDQIKENPQNTATISDIQSIQSLDTLLQNFSILNMADVDASTVATKIQELQKLGKVVNTLEITQELAKMFENHSQRILEQDSEDSDDQQTQENMEQPEHKMHDNHHSKKVSQGKMQTSKSYILKFFFGFVFIIILLGSLSTITNMDNRKDTLLYAKFIADVGAR